MLMALVACSADPTAGARQRETARKVSALAARHGLAGAAGLDALVGEAERIGAERRIVAPWRQSARVRAAWGRVALGAARLHGEVRAERRRAREDWQRLGAEAEAAVARARSQVEDPGLAASTSHLLAQASTLLGQAQRLAAAGEHARAVEAAERAIAATDGIGEAWAALHERFDDPALRATWSGWVRDSLARAARDGETLVVVDKLRRRLEVFADGRLRTAFVAELGVNGLRRKLHAGDRATPEGRYRIVEKRGPGATRYYKALLLDYPNPEDLSRWRQARSGGGAPVHSGPGGLIEIHGEGGRGRDWTDGCVALANRDMDRLFELVEVGSPVTIVGSYGPGAPPG